jgi:hypothetical protein
MGPVSRGESFETIDLGCMKESRAIRVTSDRVRLKGHWCTADRAPAAAAPRLFTVENPQAQHRGDVYFEKTWPQFTTEFIPLTAGANEIRMRVIDGGGATREFQVSVQKN